MNEKNSKGMSLKDKIALCSGADFWSTKAMPEYDIPAMMMCDGPHGLRKQLNAADMPGKNKSLPATCFPTAAATSCSWDPDLLSEIGEAIGREAAQNGVGMVLGPGANIKRNPLCGRNFEYFSEDPLLTGKLAAGFIRGVESTGVSASLKHFACNSQEFRRFSSDSVLDERTLRELYLTGFEIAVKEGHPSSLMCAYNKINGEHCSDSKFLLTDILRKEWGFDGLVVTDWGAMGDRIKAFRAGCDLNMPGGSAYMESEAQQAVKTGTLSRKYIDLSAQRVIRLVKKGEQAVKHALPVDMESHYQLARKAARESAVLLKNQDQILPLKDKEGVVFLGHMAKELRYQGSGSSHVNPWRLSNPLDACPDIPFEEGYLKSGETTDELISKAVNAAKSASTAVIFAGLSESCESEGFDREDMTMPRGHLRLIESVAEVNPNTVVVLLCGSPVECPWADRVKGILYMGLPGEAGGEAISDLLFGKANPGGRLSESWPMDYSRCVSADYYARQRKDAHYREGLYCGYRYYTSAKVPVRFPFGYGLSYTSFSYSDLKIEGNRVSCSVTNTGDLPGSETLQLYVSPPKGPFYRPVRELRAFKKVFLNPGQKKRVSFILPERSFALWNQGWVIPGGTYTLEIGKNCEEILLTGSLEKPEIKLNPPEVPDWYFSPEGAPTQEDFEGLLGHPVKEKPLQKGSFTMENTVMEMKDCSLIMKMMYWGMETVMSMKFGGKKDYSDPGFRMLMASSADSSLSGMKICGKMNNHLLEGLLDLANGHYGSGILKMVGLR